MSDSKKIKIGYIIENYAWFYIEHYFESNKIIINY